MSNIGRHTLLVSNPVSKCVYGLRRPYHASIYNVHYNLLHNKRSLRNRTAGLRRHFNHFLGQTTLFVTYWPIDFLENSVVMSDSENKVEATVDRDSEYESADDADFQDSEAFSNSSSDESDMPKQKKKADKDLDSGDEVTIAKQKRRKGRETDDLILTRAQKRAKYFLNLVKSNT
jgi:hypothetical protein